jgi:myo-inositol 2-dehydrogenase/D-chiro-inositol 1-dehydrogenase
MDRYTEAYANEMKAFCKALSTNSKLPVSGKDGLISVAIALAAKKSYLENRPVKMDEFIKY